MYSSKRAKRKEKKRCQKVKQKEKMLFTWSEYLKQKKHSLLDCAKKSLKKWKAALREQLSHYLDRKPLYSRNRRKIQDLILIISDFVQKG